ncbi:MAG: hypothetical protein OEY23_03835 [Acidimicrobiia bacterium]|nr:hypothetical protein [Acidimicrobiia bacterium]
MRAPAVTVTLDAVILAVTEETPRVLTVAGNDAPRLPAGPLLGSDRTLELALRRFVREQTGLRVGHAEQLYTFGDLDRSERELERRLAIAYLALVRESTPTENARWLDWYDLYPWEDHRLGRPAVIDEVVEPALRVWVSAAAGPVERAVREERAQVTFGLDGASWDGVRVLERYELLYEVRLVGESSAGGEGLGIAMAGDHRRIVATAVGRLRGKLTYRPVVFELLAERFTLLQLQRLVESLAGVRLHKQNFRRLVEGAGLVEGTGELAPTGGRPAELFRFRREVVRERPRPGVGTPWARVAP